MWPLRISASFAAVEVHDLGDFEHLVNLGEPAFTAAWGGGARWSQLDLHHAIVATRAGFGVGNRDLDDAVERMGAGE